MGSLQQVLAQISGVLLGKHDQVRLAVACLVAGGHLLIEDFPGVGKTTLAEALARSFGLAFRRVHFTNDLLPADLTGLRLFDQQLGQFRFEPGPLFSQVLLADEINRASPRCQSALLEAMAAGRVSVDGTSHQLPKPFCVIATQNGLDQAGTSPLPESQLDRFAMRLSLGFPPRQAEAALLAGKATPLDGLKAVIQAEELEELQQQASRVACEPPLIEYVLDLLAASRQGGLATGTPLSPRAGCALVAAAKAWALLEGRGYGVPADVQAVFPAVAEHRLDGGRPAQEPGGYSRQLLAAVEAIR